MCECVLDILKCPAKILCCCCECACSLIINLIMSCLVSLIIIGLIVYFLFYYHKDNPNTGDVQKIAHRAIREVAPQNFRDFFKAMN